MCGIVGYIGSKRAGPILLKGLKKLEYRGYDSAGIAIFDDSELKVIKSKGRLAILEDKVNQDMPKGSIGIGHTRWATHGEPNDLNSHPHISQSGKIAVVHNGIIENYIKLKEFLQKKGYKLAFGISVGIGMLFGYLPAKTAARLNPIEALRYE